MPCIGSEEASVATAESAAASEIARRAEKISGVILATILLLPVFVGGKPIGDSKRFQFFSLDAGAELLIKGSLLDRFLACMKPASIT